jgi:hypothetical protein
VGWDGELMRGGCIEVLVQVAVWQQRMAAGAAASAFHI